MKARLMMAVLVSVLFGAVVAGAAVAKDATTYQLVCGSDTYTVVKGSENASTYTDGQRNFVTAIGSIKTGGGAQPQTVECTINGFGPVPFLITPAH
jgi:hypothetical protein